jgi:hypothetical protein
MTELHVYRRLLIVVAVVSVILLCAWSVLILTWLPAQELLHEHYLLLLWIGLIPGIAASMVFLAQHRPTRWLDPAALNSSGWVIVIFLLYVRSAIALALQHNVLLWRGPGNALNSLGFALAIDLLLIYRVISFLQYRTTFRKRKKELDAEREDEDKI